MSARHDLQSGQLQRISTFVAILALVTERFVITLSDIDELSVPSVTKVAPNIHAQVGASRRKALISLVNQLVLIRTQLAIV